MLSSLIINELLCLGNEKSYNLNWDIKSVVFLRVNIRINMIMTSISFTFLQFIYAIIGKSTFLDRFETLLNSVPTKLK